MTKLLMSAERPAGFKLEDLLLDVIADLHTKNRKNAANKNPAALTIAENNRGIVNHLTEALAIQRDTLATLDAIGPDKGPTGTPRI